MSRAPSYIIHTHSQYPQLPIPEHQRLLVLGMGCEGKVGCGEHQMALCVLATLNTKGSAGCVSSLGHHYIKVTQPQGQFLVASAAQAALQWVQHYSRLSQDRLKNSSNTSDPEAPPK